MFHQVFVRREYAILADVSELEAKADGGLVIDCGANVGYASAYILSRFPHCRLIAVEPDAGNFRVLQENLASYGSRARAINSAIWSHPARLIMSETNQMSGQESARQVRECHSAQPGSFSAIDIPTLISASGCPRVALLKIDVEGSEVVLFSKDYDQWIHLVDVIVVELHDDTVFGDATAAFMKACNSHFHLTRAGELTMGVRLRQRTPDILTPLPGGNVKLRNTAIHE